MKQSDVGPLTESALRLKHTNVTRRLAPRLDLLLRIDNKCVSNISDETDHDGDYASSEISLTWTNSTIKFRVT